MTSKMRKRLRAALLERDGYVCALCPFPLEEKYPPGDRWSITIDHIVPQSMGGTHELSNTRAVHHGCNSRRGARMLPNEG